MHCFSNSGFEFLDPYIYFHKTSLNINLILTRPDNFILISTTLKTSKLAILLAFVLIIIIMMMMIIIIIIIMVIMIIIIIIIIIIIFIGGAQLPMAVLRGSLIKVTKVIN